MTSGRFTRARDATAREAAARALAPVSVQACTVQCTWSFFAPCSANLPPLSLATNAAPSCIMFARSTGKTSTHTRHLDVLSIACHIMSVAQRSRQNWEILSRRHRRPLPPLLLLTKKQFHQMRPPNKKSAPPNVMTVPPPGGEESGLCVHDNDGVVDTPDPAEFRSEHPPMY